MRRELRLTLGVSLGGNERCVFARMRSKNHAYNQSVLQITLVIAEGYRVEQYVIDERGHRFSVEQRSTAAERTTANL